MLWGLVLVKFPFKLYNDITITISAWLYFGYWTCSSVIQIESICLIIGDHIPFLYELTWASSFCSICWWYHFNMNSYVLSFCFNHWWSHFNLSQLLCALVVNGYICASVPIFIYCYGFIVIWTNPYIPWFLSSITVTVSLFYEPIHICFCSCFSYCHGFAIISTNPSMPWFLSLITVIFSLLYEPIHICFDSCFQQCDNLIFIWTNPYMSWYLILLLLCFVLLYFNLTKLCPGLQHCLVLFSYILIQTCFGSCFITVILSSY